MRVRLPLGRSLFFLLSFLFCLVALLPLGLALRWLSVDESGLVAREAGGSIWIGSLREARFGAVPLGDLQSRLQSLPLLVGRARIDLERSGEADALKGGISVSRHAFGVDDLTASLPLGPILAPLPIASLDLSDLSVHFVDGLCSGAEGMVKANIASDGVVPLPSTLSGDARCDGGALLLPLAGRAGTERLDLRLFEDGRYRFELIVRPGDEAARTRLAAAGFAPSGALSVLRAEGHF